MNENNSHCADETAPTVLSVLEALPAWGPVTTIVFASGCVFEFKGPFPEGEVAQGYYNLHGPVPGLHGHLHLGALAAFHFQERPHRGRESLALVFVDGSGKTVFKVFLGRDEQGAIHSHQRRMFERLKGTCSAQLNPGQEEPIQGEPS